MAPAPADAASGAGSGDGVIGWKLDRLVRRQLLEHLAPTFADAVADHVTLTADASPSAPLPDDARGHIVGRAVDDRGVEAMVVEIDGTTDRPGGGTYHITWSLAPGRTAQESNDVIDERGWTALPTPIPVTLRAARLD